MIVKNERHVIQRCLESVKGFIDYWVIVDTGSTDGTQELIREMMTGIPGELYERPWVHFAHNRTEALDLAKNKGDFILFMDADEYLVFPNGPFKPLLDKEAYLIPYQNEQKSHTYYRVALIDNHLPWKWENEIHESIVSLIDRPKTHEYLAQIINVTSNDGQRSKDPQKALKDAAILEKMIEKDPTNSRHVFYLAQSYHEAQEHDKAMQNYAKRAIMGGCEQERFWSLYMLARLQEFKKMDREEIIRTYTLAHLLRPTRAEPLYGLIRLFEEQSNYLLAYYIAKEASQIPLCKDMMYVEKWIYNYGILLELANTAFHLGKFQEAKETCLNILKVKDLPESIRAIVENNLKAI